MIIESNSLLPTGPSKSQTTCSESQPPKLCQKSHIFFFMQVCPELKSALCGTNCLFKVFTMSAHAKCPGQVQQGKAVHFQMDIYCCRMYPFLSRSGKPLTLVNYLQDEGLNWECHKLNFLLFEELSTSHGSERNARQQIQFSFHCFFPVP